MIAAVLCDLQTCSCPVGREKKKGGGVGGGIFCRNLLGKKQKTTTGPDFVREDFIRKDDCKEMKEQCEMNCSNGEGALTAKLHGLLCVEQTRLERSGLWTWEEWAWPMGPGSRECSQDTAGFQEGLLRRGSLLAQTDGAKVHLIPKLKNKPFVLTERGDKAVLFTKRKWRSGGSVSGLVRDKRKVSSSLI